MHLARRRLRAADILTRILSALLRAGALLAFAGGCMHLLFHRPPLNFWLVAGAFAFALADTTTGVLRSRRSLTATAADLDRRAATRDRFATALVLTQKWTARAEALAPVETLALAECERFIARFSLPHWTPLRLPRARVLALLAPAISLGLLVWHDFTVRRAQLALEDPALGQLVARQADDLQKVADALRHDTKPPDLAQLAAELEAASQRMREAAAPGQDAETQRKAALRELSALQEKLAQMKAAARGEKPSSAELAALAAALERDPATSAVAEALRANDLAGAAEQLEKLLQQMKENGDPKQTLEQLARAMQENAAKLSEAERTEVARQMQAAAATAGAGQAQLSAQAMRRLAELLRRAAAAAGSSGEQANGSQRRAGAGRPLTAKELQNLLNALEAMKDSLRPGGEGGRSSEGAGFGLAFEDFPGAKSGGGATSTGGSDASGLPGGEHDTGVGKDIAGERPADPQKPGKSSRLQGALGDDSGETAGGLLLPTVEGPGGGGTRAGRRYRELYEAMEPAAQEALRQEEIPLGSRVFVGRYFKSIRPPE